jgi:uncharacterized protein with NRDE domain
MCLIVFSWKASAEKLLMMAANRDEFYKRPTSSLQVWNENPSIIAGKDLVAGGIWMGVNKSGKFAAVTNYRDPKTIKTEALSRGNITLDYLKGEELPEEYLIRLARNLDKYNGFNLILGDQVSAFYFSNVTQKIEKLKPGFYGLSNHLLDTGWPKVVQAKKMLEPEFNKANPDLEIIFKILRNPAQAAEELLPDTGIGKDLEKSLSPIFIETPNYGTRCSSFLNINRRGFIRFHERNYVNGRAEVPDRFVQHQI